MARGTLSRRPLGMPWASLAAYQGRQMYLVRGCINHIPPDLAIEDVTAHTQTRPI